MTAPTDTTPPSLGQLAERTFDAIIFDMDGTLINSLLAVERSWATWAVRYGITAEQLHNWHGVPAAAIIAHLIPEEQRDQARLFINELELVDTEGIVPLPGAVEAFGALDDSRRAIATSCHRDLMEARIIASDIPRPAVTVTVDDVERGKPHPDPFLLAAQRLGMDPTRCLVVEDATAGLIHLGCGDHHASGVGRRACRRRGHHVGRGAFRADRRWRHADPALNRWARGIFGRSGL